MKQFYQSLCILAMLCLSLTQVSAQIYVKQNATGANNGTSWADAYTTLDAALATAVVGSQVWVAAGTYKPNTSVTPNNSFKMKAGVSLYGGFAGTETALSQRNFLTNATTLSGDINGDDSPTDLTLNRTDNALHVLVVNTPLSAQRAIIDGFTIRNGTTKTGSADADQDKNGGGILAVAKATIRNCHFTENYALNGGSIAALDAVATTVIVENCLFDNNRGTSGGAGVYCRSMNTCTIKKCIFQNNAVNRGALYPLRCKGVTIDSCQFENNKGGADEWGGGVFSWASTGTISNCSFKNNIAHNAAGIYNDGREGGTSQVIDHCTFEDNNVLSYGGTALYNYLTTVEVKNCSFKNNMAPTSAAAIYNGSVVANIHDCSFEGNQAKFGAAIANYSAGGNVTIDHCLFDQNKAATSGGGISTGFTAKTSVKNSTFTTNNALFGGAMFAQNDSTEINVEGCTFQNNNADNNGGAIDISAGIHLNVKTSLFSGNTSNFGAAIEMSEDSLDLSILNIDRSTFRENVAFKQAGALNIDDADVNISNTLFGSNSNFGDGAGGAISSNASGGKTANLKIINSTFADNQAPIGAGIAQFQDDSSSAHMWIQNCIFSNVGTNYEIEQGNPQVTSLGGNLSTDGTLDAYFGANDISNSDPQFVNAGAYNYHILANSPCINKGVAANAPAVDLDGVTRTGLPDIGCYEYVPVGTHEQLNIQSLQLSPNPAANETRIRLSNDYNGKVSLTVADLSGKKLSVLSLEKSGADWQQTVDLSGLPTGVYRIQVQMGGMVYVGNVLKQN